ncbi:MAG: hypothetical protein HY283_08510 [Nitrospirae bacterium]|nr:hypothetical protein [Nitrospirota bacterium]
MARYMRFRSFVIWKRSVNFHLTYWKDLLPVLPILCVPIFGDLLQSILISQKVNGRNILPWQAVQRSWSLFPPFFFMKIYFEGAAILWSLVPIYGIFMGIKYRLYWAMASNVIVFEGLSGENGRKRCRELIDNYSRGMGVSTLVTVPALLMAALVLIWTAAGTINEPFYIYGFWTLMALLVWVGFLGSGAVNTFLYLETIGKDPG